MKYIRSQLSLQGGAEKFTAAAKSCHCDPSISFSRVNWGVCVCHRAMFSVFHSASAVGGEKQRNAGFLAFNNGIFGRFFLVMRPSHGGVGGEGGLPASAPPLRSTVSQIFALKHPPHLF